MTNYKIETSDDDQLVINMLEEKIYEYNSEKVGRRDGLSFNRLIRDQNENLIAGIAGWTWAGACEITQLWISHDYRHNGIGKDLLAVADDIAKEKGCKIILVKTYSFQAPEFYVKHGYEIRQVIENFPTGYRYFTLTKLI